MLVYQKYVEIDTKRRFDIAAHHVDGVAYKIKERKVDRSHFLFGEAHLIIEESLEIAYLRKSANLVWRFRHQRSFFSYKIYRTQSIIFLNMNFSFLPHPPNSAWLPPLDPNDEVLSFLARKLLSKRKPWSNKSSRTFYPKTLLVLLAPCN